MSGNNVAIRPDTPLDKMKRIINNPAVQSQFDNALKENSSLFVASLIDVFASDNYLQKCEPGGVISEALKAAVLKLPISKSLGFAYLVPYKGNAQFQIGYKGMIQLAMRSGQLKTLNASPVLEGELKKYNRFTGEIDLSGEATSDKPAGYYVYMELINGFQKSEYWSKEKVIAHALEKSPSYDPKSNRFKYSAWFTDFDKMALKTVLRSLLGTYAPMSVDFLDAVGHDKEDSEPVQTINPVDILGDSEDEIPEDSQEGEINTAEFEQEEADQDEEMKNQGPELGF